MNLPEEYHRHKNFYTLCYVVGSKRMDVVFYYQATIQALIVFVPPALTACKEVLRRVREVVFPPGQLVLTFNGSAKNRYRMEEFNPCLN